MTPTGQQQSAFSTGKTQVPEKRGADSGAILPRDADLAALIAAWPKLKKADRQFLAGWPALSAAKRKALLAMLDAMKG
jgi:hypothetical protein